MYIYCLLIVGIVFITIYLTQKYICKNCEEKIVYRYIPRTIYEEMDDPVYVSDIFKSMFEEPSTWIMSINDDKKRKKEAINKYSISQY